MFWFEFCVDWFFALHRGILPGSRAVLRQHLQSQPCFGELANDD
jgi:hypothetical protein